MMLTAIQLVQQILAPMVSCPVVSKVPARRPSLFVRVDQAAPRRITPVEDQVLVIVQVQGINQIEVIELCQRLHEALLTATHPSLFGVDSESGPQDFPDPEVPDEFRWQFTVTVFQALT